MEVGIFWYFAFFKFYGCRNALRRQFWGKILQIFSKIAILACFDSHKIRKKENIQKPMLIFVAKTLRYIYTGFWVIWTIFHRLDTISVVKKLQNFCGVSKKMVFFGKKSAENCRKFGNQYKPLKYTSSPNCGSFGPFLAKKLQF